MATVSASFRAKNKKIPRFTSGALSDYANSLGRNVERSVRVERDSRNDFFLRGLNPRFLFADDIERGRPPFELRRAEIEDSPVGVGVARNLDFLYADVVDLIIPVGRAG